MSAKKKKASDGTESVSKRQKRATSYRQEHTDEWPFIVASQKSPESVHCRICVTDFKIGSGGRTDINNHVKSTKHVKNANEKTSCRSMDNYVKKTDSTPSGKALERAVRKAELMFTDLIIDSNLQVAVMDKITLIVKKAFPDSAIAQKFASGASKTAAVIQLFFSFMRHLHNCS